MIQPADDHSGSTPIRDGFSLDAVAVAGWMQSHVAGYAGPLQIEQFRGGQSNPTYKLITPERTYVLRKKPSGQLLKGAHAVDREARVIAALHAEGFPVPDVCGTCADESVLGSWFFVMEHVQGRIIWNIELPENNVRERAEIYDSLNDTLAKLHSIDYRKAGLEGFGRAGGYVARQIATWTRQYREGTEAGRDPNMDRVIEWLESNAPAEDEPVCIVHGDYRIDNVIFHATRADILAVLDWELSTLGNPSADFAYHAMMYHVPGHIVAGLGGLRELPPGIPDERTYLERYCATRGIDGMPNYRYYLIFNVFRLAAIFHGIKLRVIRGNASSAHAAQKAKTFPELAAIAWRLATGRSMPTSLG